MAEPQDRTPEAVDTEGAEVLVRRKHFVRRMYDWVLHWADTPYGAPALFLLSFAEASFFPIPPDVLLMALAVGAPKRALRFATVCSIASVVGGLFGYLIGRFFWLQTQDFFYRVVPGFTEAGFQQFQAMYDANGAWIVFAAGFTPIPFKIFTIASGVAQMALPLFLVAAAVSRSARFFLVAGLIYFYGPKIRDTIDRYFDAFALLFTLLLIGGFVVLKLVGH